jgi:hypothetical protein
MEPLKDFYNRIIGYIDTKPNGDQVGYDFYRRIVGYYEKQKNITTDFYRRIVGKGNILSSLIYNAEVENKKK